MKKILLFISIAAFLSLTFLGQVWGETLEEYREKGIECYFKLNFKGALDYWEKGLETARKQKDKNFISKFLNNIGLIHYTWGNYQKASEYFEQEEEKGTSLSN